MSLPWTQRKARLVFLLNTQGDEDTDALALDRILHGQSVIGKTCKSGQNYINMHPLTRCIAKTTEIDALRFTNRDLDVVGTLEHGQFGVVCIFTFLCTLLNLTIKCRSMWSLATLTDVSMYESL
jgi:hypothetical protein